MIEEGQKAPPYSLPSTAGDTVELTDALQSGPVVVLILRGHWCSYCAEQLQTFSELSYDLWRHEDVTIHPITGDQVPTLVEMRDRFDLQIQLLSDRDLSVAPAYTGIEDSGSRGRIPVGGTFVVDTDRVVQYAHVAADPADRTYANHVRHFIREGFERPYQEE